ncbi:MAG: hypothetical protein NWF06_06540 [Candidatus Bathyarchaeota archaeon]|nr:hypothetical protein [Candidatus Bathyarchaeum sp.]
MHTTVAALLFVTSAVVLACVVVDYAVVISEQTLDTQSSPQLEKIRNLENMILNQTDTLINEIESLNQTATQPTDQKVP